MFCNSVIPIQQGISNSMCIIFHISSKRFPASHFIERLPLESTHSFAGSLWLGFSSAGPVWFFGVRPTDRRRQHPHPHHCWPGPFCSFPAFIYFKFISFGALLHTNTLACPVDFFQLVKTRLVQRRTRSAEETQA